MLETIFLLRRIENETNREQFRACRSISGYGHSYHDTFDRAEMFYKSCPSQFIDDHTG